MAFLPLLSTSKVGSPLLLGECSTELCFEGGGRKEREKQKGPLKERCSSLRRGRFLDMQLRGAGIPPLLWLPSPLALSAQSHHSPTPNSPGCSYCGEFIQI